MGYRNDFLARAGNPHFIGVPDFIHGDHAFLDRDIAIAALAFLVLGDAAAAIIGKRFGSPTYWGKSPQGSLACFAVCMAVGWPILGDWHMALVGSVVATVAEALPVPMDDNMRVPIFSGLAMELAARLLQG